MTQKIGRIISHENPDLDSILSIYLLRKYGTHKYPGIEDAKLEFYPAGVLPDGKSVEELESQGILTVDTGGGRFDTHPVGNDVDVSKADKCASILVAEYLDIHRRPELVAILAFARSQDVEGKSLHSTEPSDHAFSIVNIIRGFNLLNAQFGKTVNAVSRILDAQIAAEAEQSVVPKAGRIPVNLCRRIQIIGTRSDSRAQIRIIRCFDRESEGCPELLDLDSALSIYLLKNYGTRECRECFCAPAEFILAEGTTIPDEASGQDIILSQDTGVDISPQDGGPEECDSSGEQNDPARMTSLTASISDRLALNKVPELKSIIAFGARLDTVAATREKSPEGEARVDIFTILHGFNLINGYDIQKTMTDMEAIFDSIVAQDKDWHRALAQYETGARVYKTGKKGEVRIIAVEAESGATLRVARWKDKSDLTIYRNPITRHTTIITRRNGPLQSFNLGKIARLVRTAEAIEGTDKTIVKSLDSVGTNLGWFLHPSGRILSKGSPKAANVAPSQIPFETLSSLVLSHFEREHKLPDRYCPPDQCLDERCSFFHLALTNCRTHRKHVRFKSTPLRARLSPDVLEKLQKLKESID